MKIMDIDLHISANLIESFAFWFDMLAFLSRFSFLV